ISCKIFQRFRNRSVFFFERDIISRIKIRFSIDEGANGPVSIPFYFKQPVLIIKWLVNQRCKHRFYVLWGSCFFYLLVITEKSFCFRDFFFTESPFDSSNNCGAVFVFLFGVFALTVPPVSLAIWARERFVFTDLSFFVISIAEAASSFFLIS